MAYNPFAPVLPTKAYEGKSQTKFTEQVGTAFDLTKLTDITTSSNNNLSKTFKQQLKTLTKLTGKDYSGLNVGSLEIAYKTNSSTYTSKAYSEYMADVKKHKLLNYTQLVTATHDRVKKERIKLTRQQMINPSTIPKVLGTMGALMTDPLILATLPFGSPVYAGAGAGGKAIINTAIKAGFQEAKIAAVAEIPLQYQVYDYKANQLGLKYSGNDALINATLGIVGAGALRGTGSAILDVIPYSTSSTKIAETDMKFLVDYRPEFKGKVLTLAEIEKETRIVRMGILRDKGVTKIKGVPLDNISNKNLKFYLLNNRVEDLALKQRYMDSYQEMADTYGGATPEGKLELSRLGAEIDVGLEEMDRILKQTYKSNNLTTKGSTVLYEDLSDSISPYRRKLIDKFPNSTKVINKYFDSLIYKKINAKKIRDIDIPTKKTLERLDPNVANRVKNRADAFLGDTIAIRKRVEEGGGVTPEENITINRSRDNYQQEAENVLSQKIPTLSFDIEGIKPPLLESIQKSYPIVKFDIPMTKNETRTYNSNLKYKQKKELLERKLNEATTPKEKKEIQSKIKVLRGYHKKLSLSKQVARENRINDVISKKTGKLVPKSSKLIEKEKLVRQKLLEDIEPELSDSEIGIIKADNNRAYFDQIAYNNTQDVNQILHRLNEQGFNDLVSLRTIDLEDAYDIGLNSNNELSFQFNNSTIDLKTQRAKIEEALEIIKMRGC